VLDHRCLRGVIRVLPWDEVSFLILLERQDLERKPSDELVALGPRQLAGRSEQSIRQFVVVSNNNRMKWMMLHRILLFFH